MITDKDKFKWWCARRAELLAWHEEVTANSDKLRTPKHRANLLRSIEIMAIKALEKREQYAMSANDDSFFK